VKSAFFLVISIYIIMGLTHRKSGPCHHYATCTCASLRCNV